MTKELREKLERYDRLVYQTMNLRHEIEHELEDELCVPVSNQRFQADGSMSIYDCCGYGFDIENIEAIIAARDKFLAETGEVPEPCDYDGLFEEMLKEMRTKKG